MRIMKEKLKKVSMIFLLMLSVGLTACGKDNNMNDGKSQNPESGKTQTYKGLSSYFGTNLSGAEFAPNDEPPYGVDGQQYSFPSKMDMNYFHEKGLKLIRLPFRWERVQPELNGALGGAKSATGKTYLEQIKELVEYAEEKNMYVILDMHNFARRGVNGKDYLIDETANLTKAHFADAWRKLAQEFKGYKSVWGYDLMNEPHDMGSASRWFNMAQAAIDAIREVDSTTPIIICGDAWSSAKDWPNASDNLKDLDDPSDKLIYQAHVYFDRNASGVYEKQVDGQTVMTTYDEEGATPQTGVERVTPFVEWLIKNNKVGFIGEYGAPGNDERWNTLMDNMLQYLQKHGVPATYWSAGPRWGTYPLSIQPDDNYKTDKPQMSVVSKYKKTTYPAAGL